MQILRQFQMHILKQTLNGYKANPDMGGKWNNISSLALSTASMVTCSSGKSVVQMMRGGQIGKNTPYVIVSQGPDAFFQINPARK